jgi:hypothetical protein
VIRRGKLHPLKPDRSADPPSWLRERIEMGDGLVIKPLKGFKGKGFVALQKNPTGYLVNGVSASMFDIEAIIGTMDHCYLSSFVGQAEYARRIYPHTTNTVRLLTVWDYTINKPFIAAAVQRIGTQRSFPVDNWKSGLGGLSSDIELDGGELGPAVSLNSHGRLDRHRAHPETQRPIAGVRLPNWSAVKGKILSIAEALSFIPDAAWDCVITDDGFSILEMNGACALFVFQVHHPLLRDPRVRRFYQHHGVIRK